MPGETMQVTAEDLAALSDAFNRHDVQSILSFMTDDCVFNAAGGPDVHGTRFVGHKDVGAAFEQVWAMFPDAQWADGNHLVAGDKGVSEWTFMGTKADGSRLVAQGCDIFTFRDGKIAVKNAFRKDRPVLPPHQR